ncbi:MAG: 2'-5' RNA ligase family protein, partial [bacterium]
DDAHTARVASLWHEMHDRFGIPLGYSGALPHITFHLGTHDVETGAETVGQAVAAATPPFAITTAGLGIFGGPTPVLHLMVARSPEVANLAQTLTARLAAAGFPSTDPYFAADKWIPHITIAHGNLVGRDLAPLLAWLVVQPLAWEIPLHSLSIARETPDGVEVLATFPLGG